MLPLCAAHLHGPAEWLPQDDNDWKNGQRRFGISKTKMDSETGLLNFQRSAILKKIPYYKEIVLIIKYFFPNLGMEKKNNNNNNDN